MAQQKINPTQMSIESGVTSTTSYIKFDNGMCIQTIERTYTGTISTLWNGSRISNGISSVTLPITLTSVKSVQHTVNPRDGGNVWYMSGGNYSTSITGDCYIISSESITASKTYTVHTVVIGQWK